MLLQIIEDDVISARPLGLRDGSSIICRLESEFDAAEVRFVVPVSTRED